MAWILMAYYILKSMPDPGKVHWSDSQYEHWLKDIFTWLMSIVITIRTTAWSNEETESAILFLEKYIISVTHCEFSVVRDAIMMRWWLFTNPTFKSTSKTGFYNVAVNFHEAMSFYKLISHDLKETDHLLMLTTTITDVIFRNYVLCGPDCKLG